MAKVGYIGEKLDLVIKQGSTLGPFTATMTYADGVTPFDLTGCTIRGQIRKRALDATVVEDLQVTITDAPAGQYEFGLDVAATTAMVAGENMTDPASKYVWDMELVRADASILPLYYGGVSVFREATRV